VDPSQIDQILANLCVNARDAISDIGTVTIQTSVAALGEADCMNHPGFAPGEYVRLVVRDDGCGMDEEILGHLFEPFFTTKGPGNGTTFSIYLPRYSGRVFAEAQEPAGTVPRGHETILLVEDEPSILKLTTTMLEQQGYVVVPANTPSEATRLAREHSGDIHLVVTDVVMPAMNGVVDQWVHFIQKPFSSKGLAAKVRETLDSE
jgi:two-component system, cell cycle sensor histidine kinase and response regulator CckA